MRILFATDLSEPPALTQAVEQLANRLDAELLLLHVASFPPASPATPLDPLSGAYGFTPYAVYDPELQRSAEVAEIEAFERFVVDRFARPVRTAVREGDAARLILQDAQEQEVDLIVLGHGAHSRLERFLLGSVSGEVVRHADRPTLLMPVKGRTDLFGGGVASQED